MDLTTGNIHRKLFRFAGPVIIFALFNQLYVIVDSVIVARYAGEQALSVIASTAAVISVANCLINGAAAGCHILIGRAAGEKNEEKIRDTWKTICLLGIGFSVILGGFYFLFAKQILSLVHLPSELMNDCIFLTRMYALSMIPQILACIVMGVITGMGDSKSPLYFGVSCQILNIILDYIVVALMNMGAPGAAGASIFSLCMSLLLGLRILLKRLYGNGQPKGRYQTGIAKAYLHLALPSMFQQSVMSIGSLFLQNLVNLQGMEAINGYTIAVNINNFLIMPVIGYTEAYETFASQNLGAGNPKRVKDGFAAMLIQAGICSIVLSLLSWFGKDLLVSLYLRDPSSFGYRFACTYLVLLIPNFFLLMFKYGLDAVYKADLKVHLFTVTSIISLAVRIAVSYLLSPQHGLITLAHATLIGNTAAILVSLGIAVSHGYARTLVARD